MNEDRLAAMLTRGVRKGAVEFLFPSGRKQSFGDGSEPVATIRLTDAGAVRAAWADPELQFAELYMQGRLVVEEGDIYDFLALAKKNGARGFATTPAALRALGRSLHRSWRRHVAPERSKRNVAHHYDLDERLFRLFLDEDLQYTCARFETGDESLEEAQLNKKRHVAAKLRARPGHKVIDLGCGWGGMGLYLAKYAGADVTGVTLSEEQVRVATKRVEDEGLQDRARFMLRDYREASGKYDRVVSVGMLEHVGPHHYEDCFAKIADLLTDDGIAVIHSIGRSKPNRADPAFIQKYIFPNGHIPSLGETFPAIEKTKLMVKDVEILTIHYADTLREWRKRLYDNREAVVALYDEAFFRMWDLYLIASEISFRFGKLMNFQIILTKRHAEAPRSRAFITEEAKKLAAAGG